LQNLTINNIYIFASIVFVNLIILTNIYTYSIDIVLKFNIFVIIFFSILRCYLNNIFYNKLNIKNIIEFIINLFFVVATNVVDSFNIRNFPIFFCIFDIYIFIALSFVLYLTIR